MSLFSLGTPIGRGGYGAVYRGRMGSQPCAAKTFFLTQSEFHQAAIQEEISILKGLRHRHIIQFYDTREHNGQFYLLMDLAEGGSLSKAIESKQLDWATRTRIANEIARGFEYMHSKEVIHRDLKSLNVLLTKHMEVKLCDFGLAAVRTATVSRSSEAVRGTLRWMSPELLASKPKYTTKSDMYAFGMVMWELAANCTRPFRDQPDNLVVMSLIIRGDREELPDDTPSDYRARVERCWHQDPDERPEASEILLIDDDHGEESGQGNRLKGVGIQTGFKLYNVAEDSGSNYTFPYSTDVPSASREAEVNIEDKLQNMSMGSPSGTSRISTAISSSIEGSGSAVLSQPNGHNVQTDVEILIQTAEGGEVEAQLVLARMYEKGMGTVDQSDVDAFSWFLRAAKQGNVEAKLSVAVMYGEADQEVAAAQFTLGLLHAYGAGVEQNDQEAFIWIRMAAEQGHVEAQKNLAVLYRTGQGVDKDDSMATSWFRRAAEQGDAVAQHSLGVAYAHSKGIQQSHTEAFRWFRKAAEQGHADSQRNVGVMYANGQGVARNPTAAFDWTRKAAEQGNVAAQIFLGSLYYSGQGTRQSLVEALSWMDKAAEQGDPTAQYNVGMMYENGYGTPTDREKAAQWYEKAALQGNAEALLRLQRLQQM
ncbi:hypothetical protein BG000_000812 [Podila horticola]|nr:hypothetical protein BG000_000812 [Podila horticola]